MVRARLTVLVPTLLAAVLAMAATPGARTAALAASNVPLAAPLKAGA